MFGLVSYHRRSFQKKLELFIEWYNEFRPHVYLEGRTPNEVYPLVAEETASGGR